MKSRMIAGVVALVLALLGAAMVISYAQGADRRAMSNLEPLRVLVVQAHVPAGTPVDALAEYLELKDLPAVAVPPTALRSLTDWAGTVTTTALVPGEPLLGERLADPADVPDPGSVAVPDGLQEVSFALEPQRIMGGRISAGDTVGVFVSFDAGAIASEPAQQTTQQVFHKVLVTSVQGAGGPQEDSQSLPSGTLLVTLALTDVDAATVIFSAEFGRIWLTKEPAGATEAAPVPVRKGDVYP